MEIDSVISLISVNYNLKIKSIEKIKNVYKITSQQGLYCLKVISYELGHFLFILHAIKYLQNNDFQSIPKIILDINGKEYIKLEANFAFLTPWILARECNYDNPLDVKIASEKLAELHLKSLGFKISWEMNPRIGWFKWIETFTTRKNEILDFKKKIEEKSLKSDFDEIYLAVMEENLYKAETSIIDLVESDYIHYMEIEINKGGFCHHDFAHHNVLISDDKSVNIIDFDYCILDSHLHDLASLIIRIMKNGRWNINKAEYILNCYNSKNTVKVEDIPIMASFIEFPQEYWQLGIQYYWEKRPWGEEFFKNKLLKLKEDAEPRQEFASELMYFKYGGD